LLIIQIEISKNYNNNIIGLINNIQLNDDTINDMNVMVMEKNDRQ